MGTALALLASVCFALAATLQQRGALSLSSVSIRHPSTLLRLAGQGMWLLGTGVLFLGYGLQAAALDRGELVIVQPLLVTTVVFALPLGYLLTGQHVGGRDVVLALALVAGLGLFVVAGDPAGGSDAVPGWQWALAIVAVALLCGALLVFGRGGGPSIRAGVLGTIAGLLFGLSASLTEPTVEALHEGLSVVLSDWTLYALAVAGGVGFVVQQLSLSTGRLAPSVATVSVANPVLSIVLGVLLFGERLTGSRAVAIAGLGVALFSATAVSLAHEGEKDVAGAPAAGAAT